MVRDGTVRSVLVTGGAGFLGSRVVRRYLESGIGVRAVGHLRAGHIATHGQLPSDLEFRELDLCDEGAMIEACADQDLVIHTAAVIRADNPEERAHQERVNVDGTRTTIAACRRNAVPRLLHVSTTATVGISGDPRVPADEGHCFNLGRVGSSYHTTKHAAERLVLEANGSGLETVVVNPGVVFGRHQEVYRGGEIIAGVLRRRLVVCTDGGLSVVHVDDVAEGIRRVAAGGRSGERYILSGENLRFRTIAEIVSRVAGVSRTVIAVPAVARDLAGLLLNSLARLRGVGPHLHLDRRYAYPFYSSEKARSELGYRPRSFAEIVADYIERPSR